MPVVFQPGERPPQPLDPDATVYTTPQKVADLLQIQYPDADLLATNGSAGNTYVEIAPSDLRHTGYEAGDEIEILGDASLSETAWIGSIVLSGGNARLNLVDIANGVVGVDNYALTGTHNTADSATVQNLQAFTNGKRRGVTKSAVQHLIRRAQDKIDNLTNNAWRPMLQTAEFKNFDTYKPYRRRYYTDYVGSTPLLFRNAQQIIRLEIWQGQEYREIAAAECKMEILDNSLLDSTDYLYLCPGDGGVASLRVGTAKGEWRADFDNESTASNLSDLINKDGRRNKDGVPFSPTFTLETNAEVSGLQTANVHHEFLSSANADYGGGKLKVTSMRRGDGGENATLATTNENGIAISGCTSLTATTPAQPSGVLVNNAPGYAAGTTTAVVVDGVDATTIFAVGDEVYNAAGTRVGVVSAVVALGVTFNSVAPLTGTEVALVNDEQLYCARMLGTTLTLADTDSLANYGIIYSGSGASMTAARYTGKTATTLTGVVDLAPAGFIASIGGVAGARVKGTTVGQHRMLIDYVGTTTGDEARLRDWWCDYELGVIYFNNTYPYFQWNAIKVAYIYGERYVEKAIEDICTKLVAMDLLLSDDRSVLFPEGTQNIDLGSKYQLLKAQVAETLPRYVEVVTPWE